MKKLQARLKNKKGFTLVELLVVVAIIAILVAISIPMVTGALNSAKIATDKANMRAAEGAAMVEYLTGAGNGYEIGEDQTYYYDAESGAVTSEANTAKSYKGYNKTTNPSAEGGPAMGGSNTADTMIVKVEITEDAGAEVTWVVPGTLSTGP